MSIRSSKNSILSTLACAAALCAAPAMAQSSVTISGTMDLSVNRSNSPTSGKSVTGMAGNGLTTSYLQFAGTEDLGGGMKAGFTLGSFLQPEAGVMGRFNGDAFWSRDANVYLSSDAGKVTLGRQINPIYLSMLIFDPYDGSFAVSPIVMQTYYSGPFSNNSGNVLSADTGYSNAVSYSTPNFNGLSGMVLYSASEKSGTAGAYSANVLYFSGAFAATAAYESSTVSTNNNTYSLGGLYPQGTKNKVALVGASYDFKPVKVFAQYVNNKVTTPAGSVNVFGGVYNPGAWSASTWMAGATVALGGGNVLASYARTASGFDHKTLSVGYDYNLSKRTDVYAVYMNDQAAAYLNTNNSYSLGIRHKF